MRARGSHDGEDHQMSDTHHGLDFTGALTLLFIGLKLGGVIGWSWAVVLSPIWISLAVCLLVAFVVAAAYMVLR